MYLFVHISLMLDDEMMKIGEKEGSEILFKVARNSIFRTPYGSLSFIYKSNLIFHFVYFLFIYIFLYIIPSLSLSLFCFSTFSLQ
jgi:hypothetical protein